MPRHIRLRADGNRNHESAMGIEGTAFGSITIDGETYEHDVVIRLSGEVVKRKKKLSKKVLRHLALAFEGRSEVRFRKGMRSSR